MNFFAPAPSMDVRAWEPVGLDLGSDLLFLRKINSDCAGALKSGTLKVVEVVSGCQEFASLERGEPGDCDIAELVHGGVDDRRCSRDDWSLSAGGRWRACEPGGAGLDLVFANATLCSFRSIQFPVEACMETLAEAGRKFEDAIVGHEYDDVTGRVEDG
jgi:hypothetical protein